MEASQPLRRTPLYDTHASLGARMAPFSGWEMPIQYKSILGEARAVRSGAGLFDVSHMGRIDLTGPGAAALLNRVLSFDVHGLRYGRARYTVICNEQGGILDDCIVYRRGDERFLLIPNASNVATVLDWLLHWKAGTNRVGIDDVTSESAMIAHQGPEAAAILQSLTPSDLTSLRPFATTEVEVHGAKTFIARTGYTGEDGFELIVDSEDSPSVWKALADGGAVACGLGARDVLRLEAGLLLHGNDMDTSTDPYEAGLDRFVDPDREGYVAGGALRTLRDRVSTKRLVGFNALGRGIPRHSYPVVDRGKKIGFVTSGGYSPTLDRAIGLGYVPTDYSAPGSQFQVDIRGRLVEAEVTTLPFFSRKRGA